MDSYQVRVLREPPDICVAVPGSKSMTNRALLMAAMAQGETMLSGVLFSDDSRVFLQALQALGFSVAVDEQAGCVRITGLGGEIPQKNAEIYVGSAGTAARFLTAFVAVSDGCYRLNASPQMKKRPMKELLDALRELGAVVRCLEEEDTFPLEITGIGGRDSLNGTQLPDAAETAAVSLNIDRSSQFLSALLMTAPVRFGRLTIRLVGSRDARSYVEMTEQMMRQFGHPGVVRLDENSYQVSGAASQTNSAVRTESVSRSGDISQTDAVVRAGSVYQAGDYQIEPDVSAACYFYGMAAITGGRAHVRHVKRESLQGDMKFLQVLEQMGCVLAWRDGQLYLQGPEPGKLQGVDADLSDFSDQALTLAAIAPYASGPVCVRNVGHIRGQECDRLHAIGTNLARMKVRCDVRQDGFTVYPSPPQPASVETFHDHRVAMAFALTGLRAEGIIIENPSCCRKTFENYFEVFDQVLVQNGAAECGERGLG